MTREDIIGMAREAGLLPDNSHPAPQTRHMDEKQTRLERFFHDAYAAGAAAEREACAITGGAAADAGIDVAAAIRARGQS